MKNDILKIKVRTGYNQIFEQYCKENKIYFKPFPEPIISTYRVECLIDKLFNIHHCIFTIEDMSIITLS